MNRKLLAISLLAVSATLAGCGPYEPSFPTELDDSNSSTMRLRIEPALPAKVEFQTFYASTAEHCKYTPRLGFIPLTDAVASSKSVTVQAGEVAPGVYTARAPRPADGHCKWKASLPPQTTLQIDGLSVLLKTANLAGAYEAGKAASESDEQRFACRKRVFHGKRRSPSPPHDFVPFDEEYFSCDETPAAAPPTDDAAATITVKVKP